MGIYKKHLSKYKLPFSTAVICVFFEAMCDLLQPTVMSHIIDEGVRSSRIDTVIGYGLLMLAITALGAGFATVRSIISSRVSQRFGADLRSEVFGRIINFSEVSADKIESGTLITRVTNDTNQIIQFVNGLMRIFFKAPVVCIGSIILAVILSAQLSLILLAVIAIVTALIIISMRLSYIRFARVQKAVDKINTVVQEYLIGVRLVKAFGRFRDEEDKFEAANGNLSEKTVASQLVISYFSPLLSLSINLGIAAIVYVGSLLFTGGAIEVGKVAAFVSYMAQILTSLIMITNIFNTFVRTKASTERINEVLTSDEDFPGSGQSVKLDYGDIAFENVTFAYPGGSGKPAVKDLSFRVNHGETLAVIGPTGSGKSTLAWLCLHFYDVDKGAIYLNDSDVKTLDNSILRENMALAPQKSMLFTGTVFENITWGKTSASREDAEKAALIAQADGFIRNMPDGYDSILGQGGVNLSGGQKQRISIARALAKDAPVLILDDCTSALDAVTEAKIRHSLKDLSKEGKAVVIITQRIATAMFADKILVLDNGESAGLGSHDQLLRSCATYRGIYESQIGSLTGQTDGK
jgi:ATP-binding cassette subfamily B multidrug efflux pump